MSDRSKTGISEEEAERLTDLDSIPCFAEKLTTVFRDVFEMPDVEITDALEFAKQLHMIPEEEARAKLYENFLSKRDPADLRLISDTVHCAGAINRHDDYEAGDRFTLANRWEPLPCIWVTGEPNTNRRRIVSLILTMCSKRSFNRSGSVDCELDDEQKVLEQLFGSYFETAAGNETRSGKLAELNNGFLIFYKAESMPPTFQKKLLTWKENCVQRREAVVKPHMTGHQDRSGEKAENLQKLVRMKEQLELLDVALFFIADRPPRELVEKGIILQELASGSIHIPVPPLRECPKLTLSLLRSFILKKPTLTAHVSDPLKYWSKGALEVVSSFHWPDNLAGLRGLVDTLFFKGVLRSGKDKITEDHVRGALWEMYGPLSRLRSAPPVQAGSSDSFPPLTTQGGQPRRKLSEISDDELINRWKNEFKEEPGGKTLMAEDLKVDKRNLCKRLSDLGCKGGAPGRPKKRA